MNISLEEEGRLRVDMTEEDLAFFGLDYSRLDYGNQKTKEMLRNVLEASGRLTGFSSYGDRLLIEVFPAPAGGCTVFFTCAGETSGNRLRVKKLKKTIAVFDFEDSEKMLSALGLLYRQGETAESDLFEINGKYRLVVHEPFKIRQSEVILHEYSAPAVKKAFCEAYAREHGRLISCGQPIVQIGSLFST